MKVVDASVVLGWLLPERTSPTHRQVLDDHIAGRQPLVAPELLHYEVANVLATGAKLPADVARDAYSAFVALEVETYSLGETEYQQALALARGHRVTVYDASYAALARALRVRLITADRRLARRLAHLDLVELLP